MNTYTKLCPNVWIAKCENEHQKGDVIQLTNKYGNEADVEIHNQISMHDTEHFYYSFTRMEGMSYAERKAEKYKSWAASAERKSDEYYQASHEGKDFLALAEPIKIGHHSEKRHRALIDRNWSRMGKSVEQSKKAESHQHKAEYWESRANDINLSMPESLEYFKHGLDKAVELHRQYKSKEREQEHSYSMSYARKTVKELEKKIAIAEKLWGQPLKPCDNIKGLLNLKRNSFPHLPSLNQR